MHLESASAPFAFLSFKFFRLYFHVTAFGFYFSFRRDVDISLQHIIVRHSLVVSYLTHFHYLDFDGNLSVGAYERSNERV